MTISTDLVQMRIDSRSRQNIELKGSVDYGGQPIVPSRSIFRRVLRDIVLLGAGNAGVVIAQLFFRSIVIALLAPAAYGRLSLVLSIYNTVWVIAASGLPNSVSRYIARISPAPDGAIIRVAISAGAMPTLIAVTAVAVASGILLRSAIAVVAGAVGLGSLVYTLLMWGVLRGRDRMGHASAILPIVGLSEVLLLVFAWQAGIQITPLSAFTVFCAGNVVGLAIAAYFVVRTNPRCMHGAEEVSRAPVDRIPSSREMLGFSLWLTAATLGVTMLSLALRLGAALESYTVVAVIDVALVLFIIPQRLGSTIVAAVVPHAARTIDAKGSRMTVSRREHVIVVAPFVAMALLVAFTPVVGWLFEIVGRPAYAKSASYLALALLAGPCRVLYGIVEGVLVARGEGRFLALNAVSIATGASIVLVIAAALGSPLAAFATFVIAWWTVYLCGLYRIRRFDSEAERPLATADE